MRTILLCCALIAALVTASLAALVGGSLTIGGPGNFPDVARFFCAHFDLRGRELFIRALRRGIQRKEFRPIEDVQTTAIILAQPLAMFSVWKRSLAPYDPTNTLSSDQFYTAYLDFIFKGLRP